MSTEGVAEDGSWEHRDDDLRQSRNVNGLRMRIQKVHGINFF